MIMMFDDEGDDDSNKTTTAKNNNINYVPIILIMKIIITITEKQDKPPIEIARRRPWPRGAQREPVCEFPPPPGTRRPYIRTLYVQRRAKGYKPNHPRWRVWGPIIHLHGKQKADDFITRPSSSSRLPNRPRPPLSRPLPPFLRRLILVITDWDFFSADSSELKAEKGALESHKRPLGFASVTENTQMNAKKQLGKFL